jgi:hypothetical protein
MLALQGITSALPEAWPNSDFQKALERLAPSPFTSLDDLAALTLERSSRYRCHRVRSTTAGEMSLAETHRLGSDGEEMPVAWHTLELVSAAILELKP